MSFLNKVKNFFYEDVEEDDEEFEAREAAKREEKLQKKLEKEKKKELLEKIKEEKKEKEEVKAPEKELSERELFKSEKTFNFPMDIGDDIFDLTQTMPSSVQREESRSSVKEEKNIYARPTNRVSTTSSSVYREPVNAHTEEPKKFRPSPVVSPVYGILDKNYTVDDVVEKNLDKTKEFSLEKKTVDFDSVRNRAYKELDEEIEKTLTGTKDIFYNLDEDDIKEENTGDISDFVEEAYDKDENEEIDTFNNNDDVIITYEGENTINEETDESPVEEDFETPDVEIPKVVKKTRKKVVKEVEDVVKKEPKEEKEDLFNLIDNMYNDEEEEEEDD